MELEHYICMALGALFGGLAVLIFWMCSPDGADAERYRWLKATSAPSVTNSDAARSWTPRSSRGLRANISHIL